MKKTRLITLLSLIPMMALSSCSKSAPHYEVDKIAFDKSNLTQESFGGLGVEWGVYEDIDKLAENGWERIIKNMDHLAPSRVRVMVSYDWFVTDFDNKGNTDKSDDTWNYNFSTKTALNLFDILEYCQIHDIDVAFGAWNVVADLAYDVWGMMEDVTSDIRWAKITGEILNFLVKDKGFTCIKWFVNSNEPNYAGYEGQSKNYNNTYEKWQQGVKNVRKTLDSYGLNWIGIVGGDTTGVEGTREYLTNIAKNMPESVGDYGCHLYINNFLIDRGGLYTEVKKIYNEIQSIDKGLGKIRFANIWESGLLDGKNNATDCQAFITSHIYGVRMGDYTLQCIAAGINGIVYWDFDDGMHFMYTNNTQTPKEWGMFSSLASATPKKQELRPWYHSSCLLTHLLKEGNKIYSPGQNDPTLGEEFQSFRSIGTVSPDGKHGGFAAVNADTKSTTKTFYLDEKVEGDKLYIYYFNESSLKLDEEGWIIPNDVISGSLNKKLTIQIPSKTMVVVSNEEL